MKNETQALYVSVGSAVFTQKTGLEEKIHQPRPFVKLLPFWTAAKGVHIRCSESKCSENVSTTTCGLNMLADYDEADESTHLSKVTRRRFISCPRHDLVDRGRKRKKVLTSDRVQVGLGGGCTIDSLIDHIQIIDLDCSTIEVNRRPCVSEFSEHTRLNIRSKIRDGVGP